MAAGAEIVPMADVHKDADQAINYLSKQVQQKADSEDEVKKKEDSIMKLGVLLAEEQRSDELQSMIKETRPFLASLPQAKAANLVRRLVDMFLEVKPLKGRGKKPQSAQELKEFSKEFNESKIQFVQECIAWATEQKRVFLRQILQARLVRLYNEIEDYTSAQDIAQPLIKELKKLDDKDKIVEVQLEESKALYHLGNLPKARAALTSARTTGNAIYIPPKMQAALDMQSGILHAADEKDFKTAFSYFYEAFEGYDSVDMYDEALRALKYMLLSKIMLNLPEDVPGILTAKVGLKYRDPQIDAMKAIAESAKKRSLEDFKKTFGAHRSELQQDPVVKSHFQSLYDSMVEKNLCRIIEPYSQVQVDHVAKTINMPPQKVEKTLSRMILDNKFSGILDQGKGVLIVYEDLRTDKTQEAMLATFHAMGDVLDDLFHKAKRLT